MVHKCNSLTVIFRHNPLTPTVIYRRYLPNSISESDAWRLRGTRPCLFLLRCTNLMVLSHLYRMAALVCMIGVRLFAGLYIE
jgi:hypothetical protein